MACNCTGPAGACPCVRSERFPPLKPPTEVDSMNALRVKAERRVSELKEALHLIASTTTDAGAREEAQRALGVRVGAPSVPPSEKT